MSAVATGGDGHGQFGVLSRVTLERFFLITIARNENCSLLACVGWQRNERYFELPCDRVSFSIAQS
jgi:hypothetical protein